MKNKILKKIQFIFIIVLAVFCLSFFNLSCQSDSQIKFEQYYIGGKELYETHCANCHQKDGSGLQNLYPPINTFDFLKNKNKLPCIIKNGLVGEIIVEGKTYNQPMPANRQLQDLDIAEIMTYLNKEFAKKDSLIDTWDVKIALEKCN